MYSRFAIGSVAFLAGAEAGVGGRIDVALIDLALDDASW